MKELNLDNCGVEESTIISEMEEAGFEGTFRVVFKIMGIMWVVVYLGNIRGKFGNGLVYLIGDEEELFCIAPFFSIEG